MRIGVPSGLRGRRVRVILLLGAVAVLLTVAVIVVVPMLRPPGPRPPFQLPVACGETWRLATYPGHDDYDVDLFPTQGEAWGRPVLASAAGRVVEAGVNGELGGRTPENPNGPRGRGGGYWVVIDHGDRWQTQYLHLLEPPLVRVGDRVTRGEQVGKIGSTGNSGAPHLHYEQHRGRQKVEAHFDGAPSGITTDDTEYSVTRTSNNCLPAR
ncbi:M23 family metallopeptidase [Plantactinospora sp. GCM10030261]|uniref:M23 family metallopeptidase n=1 Tax=Plantactinospora sp. GCM10030261 TaxID=3273420 RepID=UPI0036087C8C